MNGILINIQRIFCFSTQKFFENFLCIYLTLCQSFNNGNYKSYLHIVTRRNEYLVTAKNLLKIKNKIITFLQLKMKNE